MERCVACCPVCNAGPRSSPLADRCVAAMLPHFGWLASWTQVPWTGPGQGCQIMQPSIPNSTVTCLRGKRAAMLLTEGADTACAKSEQWQRQRQGIP